MPLYNPSGGAGGGIVDNVVAGSNITVDATDPTAPIVNADAVGTSTGTTVPGSGTEGEIFFDTDDAILYVYVSGVWTAISGGAPAGGTFDFIDGTGFDFVDGTNFDFIV